MILSISVSPDLCFTLISVYIPPLFLFSFFPLYIFFISDLIFSNWISSLSSRVLQLLSFTSHLYSLLIVGSWFCPAILLLFSLSFLNLSFKCFSGSISLIFLKSRKRFAECFCFIKLSYCFFSCFLLLSFLPLCASLVCSVSSIFCCFCMIYKTLMFYLYLGFFSSRSIFELH